MPPIDLIMISDDEEPDPRQTLSRDLALLDEEISEVNMMVKKLDSEVSSFVALLRAAQDRLHKAQERKEQLIDDKQKLLDKKRNVTVKSDVIDVNPAIKTTPEALSSYFTYVVPVPVPTVLSLDNDTPGPELDPDPKLDPELELENRPPSRVAPNRVFPEVPEYIRPIRPPIRGRGHGRGRGSKRSYGGNISSIRRGASISGRTLDNQPKLRLKVLKLRFISYDRGLYDALCSAPTPKSSLAEERKWPSPEYDGEMEEGEDDDDDAFLG